MIVNYDSFAPSWRHLPPTASCLLRFRHRLPPAAYHSVRLRVAETGGTLSTDRSLGHNVLLHSEIGNRSNFKNERTKRECC